MIRYLRVAGGAVIGIVANTIQFFQLLWYLGVVFFAAKQPLWGNWALSTTETGIFKAHLEEAIYKSGNHR